MMNIKLKGITKYSNMVANILPAEPPYGMGSKGQNSTFPHMVMLHIKLNGITNCSDMVATGLNSSFSEQCHDAYPIKENHKI